MPRAPSYEDLPAPKARTARGGPTVHEIAVRIEVVTPILGGGSRTRAVDDVEIIRAATVRGHLRFWWRALFAHRYWSSTDLYAGESELWGRAATDGAGRSAVDVRIKVEQTGEVAHRDIDLQRSPGAYALWPAREPPAPALEAFRAGSTGLRVVAVTSTCFERSWLPDGLAVRDGAYQGRLAGLEQEVVLRAAFVQRPIHVSGWDMAAGAPKATSRMTAPGAVYFFERVDGKPFREADARSLWFAALGGGNRGRLWAGGAGSV